MSEVKQFADMTFEICIPHSNGIKAYCHDCRTHFLIERPSASTLIKHCGRATSIPEQILRRWEVVRKGEKTHRRWPRADVSKRDPSRSYKIRYI